MRAAAVAQAALAVGAAARERRHAGRVRERLAPQAAPHRLPPQEPRVQPVVAQRALRVCGAQRNSPDPVSLTAPFERRGLRVAKQGYLAPTDHVVPAVKLLSATAVALTH
jgi:hypothetical protein